MFGTLIQEPGAKSANDHPRKYAAPAYLKLPSLKTVQEKFEQGSNDKEIIRLIAGLDSIYPLDKLYRDGIALDVFLVEAVNEWIHSIFPPKLCEKLDISIKLEELRYNYWDSAVEAPEHSIAFIFSFANFLNDYFPLGEILEAYEKQFPGLGRHILSMLSYCPMNIGTPENIYELNSYSYWYGEDNEKTVFNERYEEYFESGEDEETSRDYANECVAFTFDQFEDCLPDWTFKRELRNVKYKGPIPDELCHLEESFQAYLALKECRYEFPNLNLPGCIVAWDKESYDFLCDVFNHAGNDMAQYGEDYYFSGLRWVLDSRRFSELRKTLAEIQSVLCFFSACMEFLLQYTQEYPKNA